MKHIPIIIALFALSLGACTPAAVDQKIIMVQSDGELTVPADEATFSFTASCLDMDIERSKNCLVEQSEEFNAMLSAYGIDKADIQTTSISQNKEYDWAIGGRRFKGFRSSITTSVKVRELSILEEVYPLLLSSEEISLGGLQYGHHNMDSLERRAHVLALENANGLAEVLLEHMEESTKEVRTVKNINAQVRTNVKADRRFEADYKVEQINDQKISINQGSITIRRDLIVEYTIR